MSSEIMISRLFHLIASTLIASLLLSAGCRKPTVEIYDAPKENLQSASPAASAAVPNTGGTVVWEKAPQWEELPPTAFRKGNYRYDAGEAGTVEITVSSFPGATGGLLANVNRWLGQAGLEPIDEEQLAEIAQRRPLSSNISAIVVDLNADAEDPDATRIYAAVAEFGGQSWFFKMTGPVAAVESQIEAFNEMLDGLEFARTPGPGAAATPAVDSSRTIEFTTPQGWVESPGSSVRVASLKIEKEGLPPADFSITSFPGDTGGTTANVNRWRRQIGLAPWTEAQTARAARTLTNELGHVFQIYDLKSEGDGQRSDGDQRILVAISEHDGNSWFFKLRGDALLLETQRPKFNALLQSVEFPGSNAAND